MSAAGLAGRRVLVVEDEVMIAMLIEDMLAEQGCVPVGPASRVEEALRLVREGAIDLAVLDLNLDGEDTYRVAEELIRRRVPFVFATGYGASGVRGEYAGRPTLQKPFKERDLADALVRALATSEA